MSSPPSSNWRGSSDTGAATPSSSFFSLWLVPFVLVGASLLFYVSRGAAGGFFAADDFHFLTTARDGSWDHILAIGDGDRFYRPVVQFWFAGAVRVCGQSAPCFHLLHLAAHGLAGTLLFALVYYVSRNRLLSSLTTIVFMVSPGYAEAVLWVSCATEVLSALFLLATVLLCLRAADTGRRRTWMLAAASALGAVFSHEAGTALFLLVPAFLWLTGRRRSIRVANLWPFAAVGLTFALALVVANWRNPLLTEGDYKLGLHMIRNGLDYLVSLYIGPHAAAGYVTMALAVFAVVAAGPSSARLGATWMLLSMVPFLGFVSGTTSRYLYAPTMGFAWMVAALLVTLGDWIERRSGRQTARRDHRRHAVGVHRHSFQCVHVRGNPGPARLVRCVPDVRDRVRKDASRSAKSPGDRRTLSGTPQRAGGVHSAVTQMDPRVIRSNRPCAAEAERQTMSGVISSDLMDKEDLRMRADALRWYHRIDLGQGVTTRGVDNSPERLARAHLPADLSGRSVLDIGAWDGFFSFEAERRGASRVVAADHYAWHGTGWGTGQGKAGFQLARDVLGSRVEDLDIDVMDLSPERVGSFDVVLFLGVLYHLPNPFLALERVASVTSGLLILETVVDMVGVSRPAAAFYPDRELNDDPTNWWGPNHAAVAGMLRSAGFVRVDMITPPRSAPFRAARAVKHWLTGRNSLSSGFRQDRAVFHAYKTP